MEKTVEQSEYFIEHAIPSLPNHSLCCSSAYRNLRSRMPLRVSVHIIPYQKIFVTLRACKSSAITCGFSSRCFSFLTSHKQ